MSLVGLDLSSSRARAVAGAATRRRGPARLDGDGPELPLAVSLEGKQPQVGRAGLALARARPHLACLDFLPYLGAGKHWAAGPHRLDAGRAVEITFAALARALGGPAGVAASLPAYLDEAQIGQLYHLAAAAGLPLLASLPAPLAAVLASPLAHDPAPPPGLVLVADADGHALTWSVVERAPGQLRLRLVQPATHLGRGACLRKLLDGVAHRCVRQSRRDPRESAPTEQALFEQLSAALDQGPPRLVQLQLQGPGWFFHLMLHPDELAGMVGGLLRQMVADLEAVLATLESLGRLAAVVVTHPAAGLPGLAAALEACVRHRLGPAESPGEEADYGEMLVRAAGQAEVVHVLPADALATTAHELAIRVHRGDFSRGHFDAVALPGDPADAATDTGPARLSFRGRDHLLAGSPFSLGRDPTCDLVFESELYPHVSGRHCEIVFDRRAYVLCDRSRHGTLLNDRPVQQQAALHSGDWIRLGPRGPVLRFLGQARDRR
jgi:hypothetical protein